MERYVLRFQGPAAPPHQVGEIKQRCKVLDESAKMLLVECGPSDFERLLADFPSWKGSKEVQYRHPEPPLRVGKAPK
jgi:hypothetical protein